MSVFDYSQTAGSNSTVGGRTVTDAMVPSDVNNAFQGTAAEIAEWRDDIGGALSTAGSSNTYTLTTNATISAYADGQMVSFVANHANTGAATLNIDSVGAKAIRKGADAAVASGDILQNAHYIVQYDASANSAAGAWLILNPDTAAAITAGVAAGSIANVVEDTTPQLGGFLDANGNYIQCEKGGDIASASPLVIDTDGDYFDVTGTTNFAAMTVAADRQFTLQFDGILTMTHGASLVLPGAANITTAAGDVAVFQSTAANTVQCVSYTKADGTAVVAPSTPAGQIVAWAFFDGTATGTNAPTAGGNVTSVTRNSQGDYTINFTSTLSSANYALAITVQGNGVNDTAHGGVLKASSISGAPTTKTTSAVQIKTGNSKSSNDPEDYANLSVIIVL